jgi:predicted transcriptional regulator
MKASDNILFSILCRTMENEILRLDELAESLRLPRDVIEDSLRDLALQGIVYLNDETVAVRADGRMAIAIRAIESGLDPEDVSRALNWQEFETLVTEAMKANGYRTVKHLVFKRSGKRFEIDVLAIRNDLILSCDCKHWRHGWNPSRIRSAVKSQITRTQALLESAEPLESRFGLSKTKSLRALPVILALADVPNRIVEGVPVVPILRLSAFLSGLSPLDSRLRFLHTPSSSMYGEVSITEPAD